MRRRNDDVLIAQFAECAEMILSGATMAACLDRFPDDAAQLEPMLVSAMSVYQARPVPVRSPDVAARSRAAYMNEVSRVQRNRKAAAAAIPWWLKVFTIFQPPAYGAPRTRPVALFAILLILFISGIVISGSVTLAADALPGDPLYGVKTATENVRLFLTPNEGVRSVLLREFGQRRIDEAQAVVEGRRPVDNLRLQGTIESFDSQQWLVSGLRVTLDGSSQVEGIPAIGAVVDGRVRAPGDGRLVLIYAELEPPTNPQVQGLTVNPAASATPAAQPAATPTMVPTVTPSAIPSEGDTRDHGVLRGQTPVEPADVLVVTATWTPTVTSTSTRRPSRTPTATGTRTPVGTPTATWTLQPPRPTPVSIRIIDVIVAINGSVWTIGSRPVEIAAETQISGNAVVGAKVECEGWERPGLPVLATLITVLAGPDATPSPVEFQDFILSINRPWWSIGGFQVKEVEGTQVTAGLVVGDLVSVRALKHSNGELWASSITKVPGAEVMVEGLIQAYSASSITIDGAVMAVDSATQFIGIPAVGRYAQAQALQFSDGSLLARVVVVSEPASTDTPTPEPTATPTPEPTATPTLEPTATPEVSPATTTAPIATATSESAATPIP